MRYLFYENKIKSISEESFTDVIKKLKSKKDNLNIFEFKDDKVFPFIMTRKGLLNKKDFYDEEIIIKFFRFRY